MKQGKVAAVVAAASLFVLASCNGKEKAAEPDAGAPHDAGPDAGALFDGGADAGPDAGMPSAKAFVVTTDYNTGSAALVDLDTLTARKNLMPLHSDADVSYAAGNIYVINRRGADNVQIIAGTGDFETLHQWSAGPGTNPQDALPVSEGKLYISRLQSSKLLVMNPENGETVKEIDLSAFADADGFPEADYMTFVQGRVFVSLQRLDQSSQMWDPAGNGMIAVVDRATDEIIDADQSTQGIQAIELNGKQPYSRLLYDECTGKLLVAAVGSFGVADGSIEAIDPATMKASATAVTEEKLGGDIGEFVLASCEKGYAIVSTAEFNTLLVSFNPATGEKLADVYKPSGFVLSGLAVTSEGLLLLGDRTETKAGIRVYSTTSDIELTQEPIDVGLPPFAIAVIE